MLELCAEQVSVPRCLYSNIYLICFMNTCETTVYEMPPLYNVIFISFDCHNHIFGKFLKFVILTSISTSRNINSVLEYVEFELPVWIGS